MTADLARNGLPCYLLVLGAELAILAASWAAARVRRWLRDRRNAQYSRELAAMTDGQRAAHLLSSVREVSR